MKTLQLHSQISVQERRFTLRLHNSTDHDLEGFKLCFTLNGAAITELHNAQVQYSLASYIELAPSPAQLPADESWEFSFLSPRAAHISDAPAAPFVVNKYGSPDEFIVEIEPHSVRFIDLPVEEIQKFEEERDAQHRALAQARYIPQILPRPLLYEQSEQHFIDLRGGLRPENLSFEMHDALQHADALTKELSLQPEEGMFSGKAHVALKIHPLPSEKRGKNDGAHGAYIMRISQDQNTPQVEIFADNATGVLYAWISLAQLFQIYEGKVPALRLEDRPRFSWRGFMLDTVRQYYSVEEIKRILRLLAFYKMNVFHWHLSDDEAWRIELAQYPQLSNWAHRGYRQLLPPFFGSGYKKYGQSYSKDEMRSIVAYAKTLGITVLPEFDLPAHSYSLMLALPYLQEAEDQSTYTSVQGYPANTLNPALPYTYEVVEHIITELVELFPGPYFHIGGDECPEGAWSNSPLCASLKESEGLATNNAMLRYFMEKVTALLRTHTKHCCAWEEVATMLPETVCFSWKGEESGHAAAGRGQRTVLCPAQYYYLDMAAHPSPEQPGATWAGHTSTEKTYTYEPCPEHNPAILGIQANLWSENLYHKEHLDTLLLPRLSAVSESAWTQREQKDYTQFLLQLTKQHLALLEKMGYGYDQTI